MSPIIIRWGAIAGAITAVLVLAGTLGAELIPWPARAQVEQIEKGLTETITVQRKLNERLDRSERRYWRDVELEAEAELKINPDSESAQRELKRAQDAIKDLDKAE